MAETQNAILKPDSSEEKDLDPVDFLALQKISEEKKKQRSVGFYELDFLNTSKELEEPEATNTVESEVTEDEDKKYPEDKSHKNNIQDGQPEGNKDPPASYPDQALPSSPKRCRKQSNPTCLCKECVENYMNLCETSNDQVLEGEQKKDEAVPTFVSTPSNSERSRSGSETSRLTNSSEDDFVGTKYEDAQVTLPYPDNHRPPECITRLSDAGLYDPGEDPTEKTGEEDNVSQVVISSAFFVEHPPLEEHKKSVQIDLCEKVDIEKGDPENEPLLRLTRRSTETEPVYPGCCQCHLACLKIVGSFVLSMVIFPALLFAAYAWLPFDAPVIPDVPTRLVYTLRCSAFASFPIVLGVLVHGISRLCASSYDPFKPREREVTIHRRFVKQSTFLFVLFFFNLSVLSTYLPQGQLKFIPLLTCLFSLSQLIYWLSFAVGRSFRGFGYGLTFLPLVSMMICNLYFMFIVEPEKMVFLGNRVVPQH
ncbi:transmembrane protein 79 [Hyla sarda]|uniref:transmembrane protein 79 n=1 Tax=Hyla sarda TaxID=327740 RepID=UPI0024C2F886|nr:transmembrane protein 79 [Hyla sarda]